MNVLKQLEELNEAQEKIIPLEPIVPTGHDAAREEEGTQSPTDGGKEEEVRLFARWTVTLNDGFARWTVTHLLFKFEVDTKHNRI